MRGPQPLMRHEDCKHACGTITDKILHDPQVCNSARVARIWVWRVMQDAAHQSKGFRFVSTGAYHAHEATWRIRGTC